MIYQKKKFGIMIVITGRVRTSVAYGAQKVFLYQLKLFELQMKTEIRLI